MEELSEEQIQNILKSSKWAVKGDIAISYDSGEKLSKSFSGTFEFKDNNVFVFNLPDTAKIDENYGDYIEKMIICDSFPYAIKNDGKSNYITFQGNPFVQSDFMIIQMSADGFFFGCATDLKTKTVPPSGKEDYYKGYYVMTLTSKPQ